MNVENVKNLNQAIMFRRSNVMSDRHVLLTPDDALDFVKSSGGDETSKYFFGLPLPIAVASGYKISRPGFFETSHSPAVLATAQIVRRIIADNPYKEEQSIAEICSGTSHNSWGFAKEGFRVDAVEQDTFTSDYARHNLLLSGVLDQVHIENTDAQSFIEKAKEEKRKYASVFIDPPWGDRYNYDVSERFGLEHTEPSLEELIRGSACLAPIIAFKAPPNLDIEQLMILAQELHMGTFVQYQHMKSRIPGKVRAIAIGILIEGNREHRIEQIILV